MDKTKEESSNVCKRRTKKKKQLGGWGDEWIPRNINRVIKKKTHKMREDGKERPTDKKRGRRRLIPLASGRERGETIMKGKNRNI